MDQNKINRINELYHKSKKEGLTEEELTEQKALRTEYRMSIINNLSSSLNQVIQNPDSSNTKSTPEGHSYGS